MSGAGRVALVTGGARGIGAAIATRLAQEGWSIACLDLYARDEPVASTGAGGALRRDVPCDVSDPLAVEASVELVERELGPVDLLVNNAGFGGPFHRIDEVALDEWERVFAVNVKGPFLLCRRVLPGMAERGWGRVVNVASVQGLRGAARSSTYAASKHALVGMTRSLALEWGECGITCNAVCPGYIDTAMGLDESGNPGITAAAMARIPAKRQGTPEEVAAVVAHLARDEASFVNGAVLTIDGGFSAS